MKNMGTGKIQSLKQAIFSLMPNRMNNGSYLKQWPSKDF